MFFALLALRTIKLPPKFPRVTRPITKPFKPIKPVLYSNDEEGEEEYYYVLEYDPTAEGENKFSIKKIFKKVKKAAKKVTKVVKKGVEIFKKGKQVYDIVKGVVNKAEKKIAPPKCRTFCIMEFDDLLKRCYRRC